MPDREAARSAITLSPAPLSFDISSDFVQIAEYYISFVYHSYLHLDRLSSFVIKYENRPKNQQKNKAEVPTCVCFSVLKIYDRLRIGNDYKVKPLIKDPLTQTLQHPRRPRGRFCGAKESLNGRRKIGEEKSGARALPRAPDFSSPIFRRPFRLFLAPHYLPLGLRG